VKSPVERHRIRTATDVERRDDSVCAQVKHDQLGISRANRKKAFAVRNQSKHQRFDDSVVNEIQVGGPSAAHATLSNALLFS